MDYIYYDVQGWIWVVVLYGRSQESLFLEGVCLVFYYESIEDLVGVGGQTV